MYFLSFGKRHIFFKGFLCCSKTKQHATVALLYFIRFYSHHDSGGWLFLQCHALFKNGIVYSHCLDACANRPWAFRVLRQPEWHTATLCALDSTAAFRHRYIVFYTQRTTFPRSVESANPYAAAHRPHTGRSGFVLAVPA